MSINKARENRYIKNSRKHRRLGVASFLCWGVSFCTNTTINNWCFTYWLYIAPRCTLMWFARLPWSDWAGMDESQPAPLPTWQEFTLYLSFIIFILFIHGLHAWLDSSVPSRPSFPPCQHFQRWRWHLAACWPMAGFLPRSQPIPHAPCCFSFTDVPTCFVFIGDLKTFWNHQQLDENNSGLKELRWF